MTRLPNPLQMLRLQAGLSQQDVARAIGRSVSTVSRVETGDYSVERWAEQLATLYGVSEARVRRAAKETRRV